MNGEGFRRPQGQRCFPGAWGPGTSFFYGNCEVRGRNRAQELSAKFSCPGMGHVVLLSLVALISLSVTWAHNRGL